MTRQIDRINKVAKMVGKRGQMDMPEANDYAPDINEFKEPLTEVQTLLDELVTAAKELMNMNGEDKEIWAFHHDLDNAKDFVDRALAKLP